jgi:mRNA-degrading endonuclease toxin of MazEF toxin-antitoxin module
MVAIRQGDIWWAELPDPAGSELGFCRPVINVSQLAAIDKAVLTERVGSLSSRKLQLVLSGINLVLGM